MATSTLNAATLNPSLGTWHTFIRTPLLLSIHGFVAYVYPYAAALNPPLGMWHTLIPTPPLLSIHGFAAYVYPYAAAPIHPWIRCIRSSLNAKRPQ